jgi:hypothetical protein
MNRLLDLKCSRAALLVPAFLLVFAWQSRAVTFTLASAGPPTWTYDLTFGPLDNCNLFTSPSRITMTGLNGVTAAGGPTSTDFPAGSLTTNNLNWTPTFTATSVTWTNPTCGSGNFSTAMHVNGFTITAPSASNGGASYATSGFAKDTGTPNSLDISGTIAGPSTTPLPSAVPTMSPIALLMTMIGLGCAGAYEARRRFQDWFGNNSNQA